jgi:hypothetical protein
VFKLKKTALRPSQKVNENNAKATAKDIIWAKTMGDLMRELKDMEKWFYFPQNYKMFMLPTQLII